MGILAEARMYARFLSGLPGFLRRTITPYRELFRLAGCEVSDFRRLVMDRGGAVDP